MTDLKQKIRIHAFKKLILWSLLVPIVGGFAFLKHFDLDLVRFFSSAPVSINTATLDQTDTQEALALYRYDYLFESMELLETDDQASYYRATLGNHQVLVKTQNNYDVKTSAPFSGVLHVLNPEYMHYFLLDDTDEKLLIKYSQAVMPNVLLIEHSIDRTHGFTIFFLIINGLMFTLIVHALWLTLLPYHLKEFKQLKIAYGLTPKMIEESIAQDRKNGRLINQKQTIITNHFCVVQTLRYTRIIALDELLELKMKHSLDILAYWWWLPRMFLYVQEERRSYRVRMSKKMIFILFQRISEGQNAVKLPKEFEWSIQQSRTDIALSPMEKALQEMNQQIFMNTTSTHSREDHQSLALHWRQLVRFMVTHSLLLFILFIASLCTAIISPVIFVLAYVIGALIITIVRSIRLFKVTKAFGGGLSIVMFIAGMFVLLIMPAMMFKLGRWLLELFVGSF